MPHSKLSDAGKVLRDKRLGKPMRFEVERDDGRKYNVPVSITNHGNKREYIKARCPEEGVTRTCVQHEERKYLICQQCWCRFWKNGRLVDIEKYPPASLTNPSSARHKFSQGSVGGLSRIEDEYDGEL